MKKYFEDMIRILSTSVRNIDLQNFRKLVGDCETILRNDGSIIVSGLGKNVPVCEKFVGTMVSLGLAANFMHTNSAVHGDLGIVHQKDLVIVLSKSGTTPETVYLVDLLKLRGCKVWLMTFDAECPLSSEITTLVLSLEHEGDAWNLVPNNSTIINLIVLQTLALELSKRMNVRLEDFEQNHPGGAIGEKLRKR